MDDFDNLISSIDNKITSLNHQFSSNRTDEILSDLFNNTLNLSSLSELEMAFIHARLHMEYYNKNSKLNRDTVKSIHSELVELMGKHLNYDELDQ